jgi:hypothetical protein
MDMELREQKLLADLKNRCQKVLACHTCSFALLLLLLLLLLLVPLQPP